MHYIFTVISEIIKAYIRIQKIDKTQIPFINSSDFSVMTEYILIFTFQRIAKTGQARPLLCDDLL